MPKVFNVTGNCKPNEHYMVDLTSRLKAIKKMVDAGQSSDIWKIIMSTRAIC